MQKKFVLAFGYILMVLTLDLLALNFPSWSFLSIRLDNGFDVSKFITWFLGPVLFSLAIHKKPTISYRPWHQSDFIILLGIAAVGILSMLLIPQIPSLNNVYQNQAHLSSQQKFQFIKINLWWITSWAFGWEIMFRYFLLNSMKEKNLKHALWLLPMIEALYHLQKPLPEIFGMFFFSLALTFWAIKRRNFLAPLLGHLIIELVLITYLIF